MKLKVAYLDCFAGISGDMFLGALVHAGVPVAVLEQAVAALGIGASLRVETVQRSGISAVKVYVLDGNEVAEHVHPHAAAEVKRRSLSRILALIDAADLLSQIKVTASAIFTLLGEAEARVHNVPLEEIHFHEVGAVDAIADIVAASAGIAWLKVDAWYCSPVNVGSGMVTCAHGRFPVPAPATAELLRGFPTYAAHVEKELVTPTGAAILRALRPSFGPQPAMSVEQIGYGAGRRDPEGFPNVLRLSVGRSGEDGDTVVVLETALDDLSPQVIAYAAEILLAAGALDVMLTPVVMKKGRPGTLLTVLARPATTADLQAVMFKETSTLGIRVREERRVVLAREHVTVATLYGEIRLKIGTVAGVERNVAPEFEDCRAAALQHEVALKEVQLAALAAYRRARMTRASLLELMAQVERGETAPAEAVGRLESMPFEDLGHSRVDHHRSVRTGMPEVIYAAGKTPQQTVDIFASLVASGVSVLATRADAATAEAVLSRMPTATYDAVSRTLWLRQGPEIPECGTIAIVCAGTSDLPVAEEAARTAEAMGAPVVRLYDVGVAGLQRLLAVRAQLAASSVIVVCAGMEGALPSVVGGLVGVPVIAVPTSVGYGASFGGTSALLGMLNSCSPNVTVVNIDNGFGAAYTAVLIARASGVRA